MTMNDQTYLIQRDLDAHIVSYLSPFDICKISTINTHYNKLLSEKVADVIRSKMSFKTACELGLIWIAQWIIKIDEEMQNLIKVFPILGKKYESIDIYKHKYFETMCKNGHLDMAKWYAQIVPKPISYFDNKLFLNICLLDHLKIAMWFVKYCEKNNHKLDIHYENERVFRILCKHNKFEMAQYLWELGQKSLGKINISARRNYAFRWACYNGNLKFAKWLVDLGGVNIHDVDEEAFRCACWSGHLKVAQWLVELDKINIHVNNEEIFRRVCKSNQMDVARWLIEIGEKSHGKIDIHISGIHIIRYSVEEGNMDMAKWLVELSDKSYGKFDFDHNFYDLFVRMCSFEKYTEAEFLCALDDKLLHACRENVFNSACGKNKPSIVRWLIKMDPTYDYYAVDTQEFMRTLNKAKRSGHTELVDILSEIKMRERSPIKKVVVNNSDTIANRTRSQQKKVAQLK